MSGFCPHDWHGTTETDLQQMAAGEDYDFWTTPQNEGFGFPSRKRQYAIHDAAIAQAKCEGLTFHTLPANEQNARMDAAEAALKDNPHG